MKSMYISKIAASLGLAAVLLTSCGSKDKNAELNDLKAKRSELDGQIASLEKELGITNAAKTRKVVTTDVVTAPFKHCIEIQGTVDAENNVVVAPQIPGLVTKIYVNEGDAVQAGQLLAETDNSAYAAQIAAIQPQLELAKDVFLRQERLWEQKIGSEVQYLQAKTQVDALTKQISAIQAQIELTKVKAPISGVVDHVGARVGQFATAQNPDPCFRIVNLASLKVKSEVAETYANKVKKGNKVMLYFPDISTEIEGSISFTAKFISPMSRTFTAEAMLSGSNEMLRPNMVSIMKIVDYENPAAILAPLNIIQNENNMQYVYVAVNENGVLTARRRAITVGQVYAGNAELTSGLSIGDKLITTGYAELTEGMAIEL
ncbi:MAG: efflux RND transporter periplasmic adaptor subunit [Flavobacteriales bacterium]|jgi:membrane fusion protein, multidrug efflux system|nr:efflux RND transporter periplasmic adaptor subunit [Flavobacteriales bacterium]MDP4817675.1 efflux RND transporter periplasmic adaptor subunit [Flavobacteriales bacterium]MDP4950442.1 efflux RND transporter periplasmic adaptor subunit [Flavobacteriales bacterium]